MNGAGGNYEWCVTADKAGEYVFKAEEKHAGEETVSAKYEMTLIFTETTTNAAS